MTPEARAEHCALRTEAWYVLLTASEDPAHRRLAAKLLIAGVWFDRLRPKQKAAVLKDRKRAPRSKKAIEKSRKTRARNKAAR